MTERETKRRDWRRLLSALTRLGPARPEVALHLLCIAFGCVSVLSGRETLSFDTGWKFSRGDQVGAERAAFGDTDWAPVTLPHDWAIAGPFSADAPTQAAGGFLPAGIGWYRKSFHLGADSAGQRVFVEFDGVMAHSDVWINGIHLGHRPSGTVSFSYDLTDHLRAPPGGDNVLVVKADNSGQPASRWYAGAGIYRHVRLVIANPVHLEKDSVFISTPTVDADHAVVKIDGCLRQNGIFAASNLASPRSVAAGPSRDDRGPSERGN